MDWKHRAQQLERRWRERKRRLRGGHYAALDLEREMAEVENNLEPEN